MSVLTELRASIEDIVERVGPSVVGLGRGWGRGSGVVVGEGRVLTNAHNLRHEEVTVTFADGRSEQGTVAGVDADLDVAVIEVDTGEAPAVEWDPGETSVGVGAPVFALANPGGRGLRATFGTVSATERSFRGPRGRRIRGSIEHSAPLPRGSSGGPLVDEAGRLLGLNSVRLDGGLILALPADAALSGRLDALARGEAPLRPRLGVAVAPPRVARRLRSAVGLPERDGVLVRGVEAGSAAERAGVEKGDLIVAVGGRAIEGMEDLYQALEAAGATGRVELTLVRGLEEHTLEAPLESQPSDSAPKGGRGRRGA